MTRYSSEEIKVKIGCFIDAALNEEIPWSTLEKFLYKMTSSLERSKEVIKVLLRIIRELQQPFNDSEIKHEKVHYLDENEVIEIDREDESDEIILDDIKVSEMECNICKKTFITAIALERHSKRHEKQPDTEKIAVQSDITESSPNCESTDFTAENTYVAKDRSMVVEIDEAPVDSQGTINDNENGPSSNENNGLVEYNLDSEVVETLDESEYTIDEDYAADLEDTSDESIARNLSPSKLKRHNEAPLENFFTNESAIKNDTNVSEIKDAGNESHDGLDNSVIKTSDNSLNTKKQFQCKICHQCFTTKTGYNKHESIHTGERPYECEKCGKTFRTYICLSRHKKIQSNCEDKVSSSEKIYKCKTCQKSFKKKSVLNRHENIHTSPFQCNACPKRFKTKDDTTKHEQSHSENFQCNACPKTFKRRENKVRHEETHSSERPYQCKTCTKGFKTKVGLVNHEKTHSKEKPFKCRFCPKAFLFKHSIVKHERLHTGELPFQCKTCGKSYYCKNSLRIHIELKHSVEKVYKCQICSKELHGDQSLKNHNRIHSGEKPFECKTCGKRFTQPSSLNTHKNIHTGEKSYICTTCGKQFNRKENLQVHEQSHSDERPYKCKFCDNTFKVYSGKLSHENIHLGNLPYQCKTCLRKFPQNRHLQNHEKTHNK